MAPCSAPGTEALFFLQIISVKDYYKIIIIV